MLANEGRNETRDGDVLCYRSCEHEFQCSGPEQPSDLTDVLQWGTSTGSHPRCCRPKHWSLNIRPLRRWIWPVCLGRGSRPCLGTDSRQPSVPHWISLRGTHKTSRTLRPRACLPLPAAIKAFEMAARPERFSLSIPSPGLASEEILLANSSYWDRSHHELSECGLPRSCEWRACEPSP
jgi:hypothetical protein